MSISLYLDNITFKTPHIIYINGIQRRRILGLILMGKYCQERPIPGYLSVSP
jgi:hypothetical protein